MNKVIDLIKSVVDLSTSRRATLAVLAFILPIISKKLGYELTQEELVQLTALVMTVIGALSVKDHNPPKVDPVVVNVIETVKKV